MARALLLFAILAVAFKQGAGIKCYMCNSLMNEHCGDPLDTSKLAPTECTANKAKEFLSTLDTSFRDVASKLGLGDMFPAGAVPVEMACQKIKNTDSSGKEMVVRACILEGSTGLCPEASSGKDGFFCEQCKTDNCNGSQKLGAISVIFYLLLPSIVALVTLRS